MKKLPRHWYLWSFVTSGDSLQSAAQRCDGTWVHEKLDQEGPTGIWFHTAMGALFPSALEAIESVEQIRPLVECKCSESAILKWEIQEAREKT